MGDDDIINGLGFTYIGYLGMGMPFLLAMAGFVTAAGALAEALKEPKWTEKVIKPVEPERSRYE